LERLIVSSASDSVFEERKIKSRGVTYRYNIVRPRGWTKKKKWPVVLFLHGAGERGDDNVAQTDVGIGPAIEKELDRLPAVFVLPQCPKTRLWNEAEMQAMALKALSDSVKEFNGDTSRLYLTGLSMGGYGTWAIAKEHPKKFAALAVICGGVTRPRGLALPASMKDPAMPADPYLAVAEKIGSTPVWVFHGSADPAVPVTESRKMVEALKSVKGDVRYTEYEGVSHNSWDRAYAEPDFFTWLLSKRLKKPR